MRGLVLHDKTDLVEAGLQLLEGIVLVVRAGLVGSPGDDALVDEERECPVGGDVALFLEIVVDVEGGRRALCRIGGDDFQVVRRNDF